jgi:hypothetical protein
MLAAMRRIAMRGAVDHGSEGADTVFVWPLTAVIRHARMPVCAQTAGRIRRPGAAFQADSAVVRGAQALRYVLIT